MDRLILNGNFTGDILVVSSNYGDTYDRAKQEYNRDNSKRVIMFEFEDSNELYNCIGLSIEQIKEMRDYLNQLIQYFES